MSDELTARYMDALREPTLQITLSRNLFGGQNLITLAKPSPTPRSKPVQLVPIIVGDKGQTHADMLRHLANALEQARS